MANVKAGPTEEDLPEPLIWEIYDEPKPFRIVACCAHDAAMAWLAFKEQKLGGKVWMPTLILEIRCLNDPRRSLLMLVSDALRARDRERGRCGLPPVWERLASYLEEHREEIIERIAEKARMAEEEAGRR